MTNTRLVSRLGIWLLAAMAATAAAEQAAQYSRFDFPFSRFLMHAMAAWLFARAAVLVFNVQLVEPAQQAAAASQDAASSNQKQLVAAGLLLGCSMAAQALVQFTDTRSSSLTAVFKSCTPALVFIISMLMRLQSTWPVWQALPVLAVCAGAGVASYEGAHIFWHFLSSFASPFLHVAMVLLQAGSICLLQQVMQPCVSTLPQAASLSKRTSSSGSSLRRSSSTGSHSSSASSVSDDDNVATPAGPSPLAALTYVAWYAMLVLALPAIMLEAPRLVTSFAGWKPELPTLLFSSGTFALYSLLAVNIVQATSAVTVSLVEVATAAAVTLVTAFMYPMNSNFPAGVVPAMQWQGLAAAGLGLVCHACGKLAVQRAAQLQRRISLDAPVKTACTWQSKDPTKVMKCSGADMMVYIQPHRIRQASAAAWAQPEGFQPLSVLHEVTVPKTPVPSLQQQYYQQQQYHHQQQYHPQQQLVYCW